MHSVARVRPTHPAPASLRRATVAKVARIHAHGRLVLHRVKEMESAGLSEPQASAVVTTVNDIVESATSDQLGEIIAALKGLDNKFSTRMDDSVSKLSTRMDEMDKKSSTRMDEMDNKLSTRMDEMDNKSSTRMDEMEKKSSTRMDKSDKLSIILISAISLLTVGLLVAGIFPKTDALAAILGSVVTGLCAGALLMSSTQGSK